MDQGPSRTKDRRTRDAYYTEFETALVPGSWFLAVPGRWSLARLGPRTSDEGPPGTEGPGTKDCQLRRFEKRDKGPHYIPARLNLRPGSAQAAEES